MTATVVLPYRHFAVSVRRVRRLSPSFVRVTFGGEDLAGFADNGYDQRIKLIFPLPGVGLAPMPTGPDWYARWRELPTELRNPIRTYTVRAVRRAERELDVDMVCHGDTGPASRWAGTAAPGDPLLVIGPDAAYPGPHGGVEFHLPAGDPTLLLAGDETAVPAICAILERLPADARGEALLEVPYELDALLSPTLEITRRMPVLCFGFLVAKNLLLMSVTYPALGALLLRTYLPLTQALERMLLQWSPQRLGLPVFELLECRIHSEAAPAVPRRDGRCGGV